MGKKWSVLELTMCATVMELTMCATVKGQGGSDYNHLPSNGVCHTPITAAVLGLGLLGFHFFISFKQFSSASVYTAILYSIDHEEPYIIAS